MNIRDPIGTYIYQNDLGVRFRVRLTKSVALAGGFEVAVHQINEYPLLLRHSQMRMVEIYYPGTNKILYLPIAFSNNINYTSGGGIPYPICDLIGWLVSARFRERF